MHNQNTNPFSWKNTSADIHHHITFLENVPKQIASLEAERDLSLFQAEDFVVYSWPGIFVGNGEGVYDQPLYEAIHMDYDLCNKTFGLMTSSDQADFCSDHVERAFTTLWQHQGLSLHDALRMGNQLHFALEKEHENKAEFCLRRS